MATDLERAFEALQGKQSAYATLWNYYDGQHPLVYSTERLREMFNNMSARFSENWCAMVVDAALDRLNLVRFDVPQRQEAADRLNELYSKVTRLSLDEYEIHKAALVCGESFVVAWREDGEEVEAHYHDPRLCHVFYDSQNPRRKSFAAKWWVGDDERRWLTLYYPDRLEYYVSMGKAESASSARAFVPAEMPDAPNPYGEIPVFHWRRERRRISSELANVREPQDAINKLLADMMVAAEFGAFGQRYVISEADPGNLRNAPNEVWWLPAGQGGTGVGQFAATDLRNYLDAIDRLAAAIAAITRTPRHYFFSESGTPSGEALIAMEAPLNKKVERYIEYFSYVWQDLGAFLLRLDGIEAGDVTAVFAQPETIQPRTEAEIRNLSVQAGMPLVTQLRREGWSGADLKQMQEDQAEQAAAQQASLASALVEAQRRMDQGESNASASVSE